MVTVPALKDKDLWRRAKTGDPAAWDTLLEGAQTLIESRVQKVIGYGQWPPRPCSRPSGPGMASLPSRHWP